MQALSVMVVLAAYFGVCAALLSGQRVWSEAQSIRVQAALNASAQAWSCAVADDVGRSGWVVVFSNVPLSACRPGLWRPEVVRLVS